RGTGKLESGGSKVFVPDSPRKTEPKGREGHEKLAGPRTNQEMPRVIRESVQNFKGQ
ncbi:hypothetical protein KI387_036869, partial [Taxus chinensis]